MQHDPAPATTEENSLAGTSPSRSFQSPGTHTMKSSSNNNNGGGNNIINNIGQKVGGEDASSHHGHRIPSSSRPGSGTASPVLDRSPSPSPPGPTPVPSHPTSPSQEDHGQAEQNGMWQPNKMLKTMHQNNNNNNNMPITQVEADPSVRKARVSVRARSDAPTVSRHKNSSFIRFYSIMNLKGRIHYKGGGGGGG